MRKITIFLLLLHFIFPVCAQNWTQEQLTEANTAAGVIFLTDSERDAIMYINLARLYPGDFVSNELENYYGTLQYGNYLIGSWYRESLIETLMSMEPTHALVFDQDLYENAKCFALESGKLGIHGHNRLHCPKAFHAECCSYGMESGKDIAMQWLINYGVESLGHREVCLDKAYNKIGIGVAIHKVFDFCAVANFYR